jgi:protein required for attachment to host cells
MRMSGALCCRAALSGKQQAETIGAMAGCSNEAHKEKMMQVPHGGCVMVADGAKMLFFRNEGDAEFLKLEVERKREQENLADRDLMTDGHGSAPAGGGVGGSTYERPDHHQLEEDRFAAEAADMLKQRALRGEFETLIIVAPPKTLGELRKHYHKEVEKRLTGEIAKDLTGHPVEEIEKIIRAK